MGSVNSNFLPATTGLSLGSLAQQWLLNGKVPLTVTTTPLSFSATPIFTATPILSIFTMTLTGNVTGSSLTASLPGFLVFQITQDSTGGRTFVWPPNVNGGGTVMGPANQIFTQLFYFDGASAWNLTSGALI